MKFSQGRYSHNGRYDKFKIYFRKHPRWIPFNLQLYLRNGRVRMAFLGILWNFSEHRRIFASAVTMPVLSLFLPVAACWHSTSRIILNSRLNSRLNTEFQLEFQELSLLFVCNIVYVYTFRCLLHFQLVKQMSLQVLVAKSTWE